jgi:hypothetical protein
VAIFFAELLMLQRGCLGVVIVAGLVTGCAPKQAPPTGPADTQPVAAAYSLDTARESLKRGNPNAEVGSVVAVLAEANFASVADIPVNDFHVGDTITFLDDSLNNLTLGVVENILNGRLQVRYDAPSAGRRAPQVGDFAVHIFSVVPSHSTAVNPAAGPDAAPVPATPAAPPATDTNAAAPAPVTPAAPPAPASPPADAPATQPAAPPTPATAPAPADSSAPKPPELNK